MQNRNVASSLVVRVEKTRQSLPAVRILRIGTLGRRSVVPDGSCEENPLVSGGWRERSGGSSLSEIFT